MSNTQPLVSAARSVLIGASDLAAARSFYEQGIGLSCLGEAGEVADDVRRLWGIGHGTVRLVRLARPGENVGMIELVEWEGSTGEPIRDPSRPWDYGLLTLNFRTDNIEQAITHLESFGASVVSDPQSYETVPGRVLREVMMHAPGSERLTLLQVGEAVQTIHHPLADAVATVGLVVPSLDEARAFFHDLLGLTVALELAGTGKPFSTLMGVPDETRLQMMLLTSGGNWVGKLEAIELTLPEGSGKAQDTSTRANGRYIGHWMTSFIARDFDGLVSRCQEAGVRLLHEPVEVDRPFVGRTRAIIICGPGGAPLEVLDS